MLTFKKIKHDNDKPNNQTQTSEIERGKNFKWHEVKLNNPSVSLASLH